MKIEDLLQALYSLLTATGLAALGRLMWHVIQVQHGNRRFWSVALIWELLLALCIGYAAQGVAEYFGLMGRPAMAAVIMLSYLGPRGIETLILRWMVKK